MNTKNIFVNPNFIPSSQGKIYVNPSFVSNLNINVNDQKPIIYPPKKLPEEENNQKILNAHNNNSNLRKSCIDRKINNEYISKEENTIKVKLMKERNHLQTYKLTNSASEQPKSGLIRSQSMHSSNLTSPKYKFINKYKCFPQTWPINNPIEAKSSKVWTNKKLKHNVSHGILSKYKVDRSSINHNGKDLQNKGTNYHALNDGNSKILDKYGIINSDMNKFQRISETNNIKNHESTQSMSTTTNNLLYKTRNKLVRMSDSKKTLIHSIKNYQAKKNKYAVKTKTKLIRRKSGEMKPLKFKVPMKSSNFTNIKLKRSLSIKKGSLLKAKERMIKKGTKSTLNTKYISPKHIYRVHQGTIPSLYKIKRKRYANKGLAFIPKHFWSSKDKRSQISSKSDKFINIDGNLYKCTKTSLKKQDLSGKTSKRRKLTSPQKTKVKKTLLKNQKYIYRRQKSSNLESGTLIEIVRRKKLAHFKKIDEFCFFFNKYGKCKKQNKGCQFIHDPKRVAICTRFLRGSCKENECPFSHTIDKSKMPVCSHFLEGFCNRESCPYRHVKVNAKAPFCSDFLKGLCRQGENCKKKHIFICEDFKLTGKCPRAMKCPLSHVKPFEDKAKKKEIISSKKFHKEKKIGVLGLECYIESNSSSLTNWKGSTVTRYFEDREGEEGQESGDHFPERPTESCYRGLEKDANAIAWEDKRRRLLNKVNNLKRNYNVGVDFQGEVDGASQEKYTLDPPANDGDDDKSFATTSRISCLPEVDSVVRPLFLPLPDKLPSYIPLDLQQETVKEIFE